MRLAIRYTLAALVVTLAWPFARLMAYAYDDAHYWRGWVAEWREMVAP